MWCVEFHFIAITSRLTLTWNSIICLPYKGKIDLFENYSRSPCDVMARLMDSIFEITKLERQLLYYVHF